MFEVLNNVISSIGDTYPIAKNIYNVFGDVLTAMLAYKSIYFLIGIFFTRKFPKAMKNHKYAIVIAARNEKNVIGNLLDSINQQDYPKELVTTFVVADNCTDNTAEIAREHGAICYERFNDKDRTKGFALQFLFENIEKDYGTQNFEGYFVFDADNLLMSDYITRMNESFDAGARIITSYRNTKNFDEDWVSSTYALHWIRSIRFNHRARSVLRLATNIQGTGFLFTKEIVKNGWKYTSLTEDRALTADAVAQGYQITYNNDAMFYDEQPTSLKIALRQRLRWSRGHLLAFLESGPKLFVNIFCGKYFIKERWQDEQKRKKKKTFKDIMLGLVESIRHRFASYDTLLQLTPLVVVNLARWIIVSLIIYACFCYNKGLSNINFFSSGQDIGKFLRSLTNITITMGPGYTAMLYGALLNIWFRLFYRISVYFSNMLTAVYLFFIERKNIIPIPWYKKILYCITWPTFDMIGRYTTYIAVFKNVTWKPIPHDSKVTINDLNKKQGK